jgi:High potential iron-sulfur protein
VSEDRSTPKSRRAVLQGAGLAALAAPVALSQSRAQDKLQPAMVLYQAMPKDGQQCSGCLHFQAPNACAIVAGEIKPDGWCAVWAKKEG